MNYSPHWSATIFAAIILHIVTAWGLSCVVPEPLPEENFAEVTAFEWVDVDLSDETILVDADGISTEPVKENSSPFNAQDLFVPELKIPEVPAVEKLPEVKPIERPKPHEVKPAERPKPPEVKPTERPQQVEVPAENREIVQPPVALKEVYPQQGSGLGYKGFVSIAATIDADGKVIETEILQSSGRYFVDEIALKAAVQWTFRPALDQNNRPMQSVKIIVFDFRKFS